jgi:hypothetical protein
MPTKENFSIRKLVRKHAPRRTHLLSDAEDAEGVAVGYHSPGDRRSPCCSDTFFRRMYFPTKTRPCTRRQAGNWDWTMSWVLAGRAPARSKSSGK